MNRPWMPLYIADYLKDTTHLRATESGAYLHLIMAYWLSGRLPDHDRQLATIAKTTDKEWRTIKPVMAAFFGPNFSSHKRIDEELAHASEISNKRKAAVHQREIKRLSNDTSNDDTLHTSPSTKKESKKDIGAVVKATRPSNLLFEKLWKAYPKRQGANPKSPAEKLFLAAVKAGEDGAQIVAAVEAQVGFDPKKIGTEFIPRLMTWLKEERWQEHVVADPEEQAKRDAYMASRGYIWLDGAWRKTETA